nr:tyrosine-type recombinase/integrase [Devosia marina]
MAPRRNPYWQGIGGGRGGVSLGYRRSVGPGVWIGKIVFDGKRTEERLAAADDDGAEAGALPFRSAVTSALEWAKRKHAEIEDAAGARQSKVPTVESAISEYVIYRTGRSAREGANASGRLRKHVLADRVFSARPLAKLREPHFDAWRDKLPIEGTSAADEAETPIISRATFNRLASDLRAALNRAAERYRRELPAHVVAEIKIGTRALPLGETARKQILSDAQVLAIVRAAQDPEIDPEGDFGRMIAVLATGPRFNQAAGLNVVDLQIGAKRLMVPGAKKGRRARPKPPAAVPLDQTIIDLLAPAAAGRDPDAPLLERWGFKRGKGIGWERDKRVRWTDPNQLDEMWAATVKKAGAPAGAIPYSLRHSSIVRSLRKNIPIRIVASLHDTSTEMIEAHYGRYITEFTDEIARLGVLSL